MRLAAATECSLGAQRFEGARCVRCAAAIERPLSGWRDRAPAACAVFRKGTRQNTCFA